MPVVTGLVVGGIMAGASGGLSFLGASKAKKQADEANRRALAAAQTTRQVNIATTRMQAVQQREKLTRDTNLLLGQLAVSAAERNVLSAQSSRQAIDTTIRGMMYNLSQININRYLQEQQIIAQTQYPTQTAAPSPLLAGLQGGLSGFTTGFSIGSSIGGMSGAPQPAQFNGSAPSIGYGGPNTFSSPVGPNSMPSTGPIPGFASYGIQV